MIWRVIVYESNRGEKYVEDFFKTLEPSTIAKLTHAIDLLEQHGSILGMPHAKKLTADLYELRIRGKQEIRIFYAFKGKNIYLLHVFKKQTQKTPAKEINTALQRFAMLT